MAAVNNNMKLRTLLSSLVVVAAMALILPTEHARATVEYRKRCELFVLPFSPFANSNTLGAAVSPHIRYASASECQSHVTVPPAAPAEYSPQPPLSADNQTQPGSENVRAPVARHEHAYINDSDHTQPNNLFFYESFLDTFEITIQPDGVRNLDVSEVKCNGMPLPAGYDATRLTEISDCEGTVGDLFGGTRVSKSPSTDGRSITITWKFGINPPYIDRPKYYGNNGSSFGISFDSNFNATRAVDLNNPLSSFRKSEFHVDLLTRDNGQIWSATTTSRALVVDLALLKSNYPRNFSRNCANGGWCYLDPRTQAKTAAFSTQDISVNNTPRTFYWFPIGSVATVWKKPPLPTLTLVKDIVNDNGGTAVVADFHLFIGNQAVQSGVVNDVAPGTYTAREGARSGYNASVWSGDCNPDGTITLTAGQQKSCTITNDDTGGGGGGGGGVVPGPTPAQRCVKLEILNTPVADPGKQCLNVKVIPDYFPGQILWEHLAGERQIGPLQPGLRACFDGITGDSLITAFASQRASNSQCIDQITPEKIRIRRPPSDDIEGTLRKTARDVTSGGNVIKKANTEGKGDTAEFQITFSAERFVPEVTIWDEQKGELRGSLGGSEAGIIALQEGAMRGKDFLIELEQGFSDPDPIPVCEPRRAEPRRGQTAFIPRPRLCYEGNPFTETGLTVKLVPEGSRVLITYRAKLKRSNINDETCGKLSSDFCGESFINRASAHIEGQDGEKRARAILYTPCPFLLTQGIGDVIVEEDFDVGSDISSCARIPNVEGPIIKPIPPPTPEQEHPKTGPNIVPNIPRHEACLLSNESGDENKSFPESYRNPIKTLSSQLCEVSLTIADIITPLRIRSDVQENITRITRYNDNLGSGPLTLTNLNNPQTFGQSTNPNFKIYKKKGDLTVDTSTPLSGGARTYIIEDGNLIINSDIVYEKLAAGTFLNLNDPNSIPVIAFIVINGDIHIASDVQHLVGVYMTLNGKIRGTSASNRPLKIDGSVYGDIEPLFESRQFFGGNAKRGEGTIVINYDGRLYYNMPPGLK